MRCEQCCTCRDLIDEDIVGQLLESCCGYLEQLPTERTRHLVSGSLVLSVLLETLEAERVNARQTLRVLEWPHAYGALQDIPGCGALTLFTRHVDVLVPVSAAKLKTRRQ